jgi:chromosome segregation ATPase
LKFIRNIQVENPVAVLDQDEAKKFLTGKPEDKYAFFMKATELERVDNVYANTIDRVKELNDSKEKIRGNLQHSVQTVEMLKSKWKEHQELDKLKTKELDLNTKFAWAHFQVVDQEYREAVANLDAFKAKAAKKEVELTQAEEDAASPDETGATKSNLIKRLFAESQEQQELKRELELQIKDVVVPYKATERNLEQVQRHHRDAQRALAVAKKRLQEARDQILQLAGSKESEAANRAVRLQEAEQQLDDAKSKSDELRQKVSTELRAYEAKEPHVADAKANVDRVQRQLGGVERTIRELQKSSDNSIAIFGERVPRVAAMIEEFKRSNKFQGPVIGPIGAFIKVNPGKEDYRDLAEHALGSGSLERFIVTNNHDRLLLNKIRRQVGCNRDCGVFQTKRHPRYRVPEPPVDGVETVCSVLNITDDIVFNCLVDFQRIDQKALTRSKKDGEQKLLYRNDSGSLAIRGIANQVYFLPDGDFWQVRGGLQSAISNTQKMRSTIGVDKTAAIHQAQSEANQFETELKEYKMAHSRLEHEHTQHQREWNKAKRAMQENQQMASNLQSEIESLKNDIDNAADITIDTSEYEDDVTQAEQTVDNLRDLEETTQNKLDESRPAIEELTKKKREVTVRLQKIVDDLKSAEEAMTQYLDTQSQRHDELEKKRRKVEQYKEVIAKHQEKITSMNESRELSLLSAKKLTYRIQIRQRTIEESESSPRDPIELSDPTEDDLDAIEVIEVQKDVNYYEARIIKVRQKIEHEKKRKAMSNEDPAIAYEKYLRAKTDLDAKMKQIDEIEIKVTEMQEDMKIRRKRWRQFRKHLEGVTSMMFNEFLTMNKYNGDLIFNHETETLDLQVQKDSATAATQTKDVKALSGGERSYTTMSLLLALGENLETPFRVLDEFDVFLDAQARKLAISILIHVAKKMEHRQFIFITPQDLSSLTPDPKLKIHKLSPPTRYQTAGAPSQQTLDFSQEDRS